MRGKARLVAIVAVFVVPMFLRADDLDEHALDPIVIVSGSLGDSPTFGAGIIFRRANDSLWIVTANHVVRSSGLGATNLTVRLSFASGKNLPAKLMDHFDAALDVAVLRVENLAAQGVDVCALSLDRLALPDSAKRGDPVFPVGNPNGVAWAIPVQPGAISGVSSDDLVFESSMIARGHSGGGLLNSVGALLAMIQADEPPYGRALSFQRIVNLLESWGYSSDLNLRMAPGEPPLTVTSANGNVEQVKRLLRQTCIKIDAKGLFDFTALDFAASRGRVEIFQILADAGARSRAYDLDLAVGAGSIDLVRLLLSRGVPCCGGSLAVAISHKNDEMVRILLDHGANATAAFSQDYALTPPILQSLIHAGADVNARNSLGDTPLLRAVEADDADAVRLLLDAGAKTELADKRGQTVFHFSCNSYGGAYEEIAVLLVRAASAIPKEAQAELLECAADRGWQEAVSLLIQHGADPKGKAAETALWKAVESGRREVLSVLLKAGVDPNTRLRGYPPLYNLLVMGEEYGWEDRQKRRDIVKLLLEQGTRVHELDVQAIPGLLYRPLFESQPADFELAALLIAHGARVDGDSGSSPVYGVGPNWTYLGYARSKHRQDVINFLLKHAAKDALVRP